MERVRIGFALRLLAAIIDCVALIAVIAIPSAVLSMILPGWMASIVTGLLCLAYWSLEVAYAASIGKMALGYAITAADGSPATQDQLVKRFAYKQVPQAIMIVAALPFLGLLGALVSLVAFAASVAILIGALMALNPEKRAYHDRLFGTAVYGPATLSLTIPFANHKVWEQSPAPAGVNPLPPLPASSQQVA